MNDLKGLCGVLFFCEGGPRVGGGHLSRCAALAAGFARRGIPCRFRVNREAPEEFGAPPDTVQRVEDPLDQSVWPAYPPGTLGVVDSYRVDPGWLEGAERRLSFLVVDDSRAFPVERHVWGVLNYNLHASVLGYEETGGARLLGPRYALLRSSFWDQESFSGQGVLLVAGAADPLGITPSILSWWKPSWPRLLAVAGPLWAAELRSRCHAQILGRENLEVVDSPPDLPERMARAGRVLCTSSVTCYEALALRKPLGVFQVADNQLPIGEAVQAQGLGTNLGPWGTWGPEELEGWLRSDLPPPPAVVNPRGALAAAAELVKVL